MERGEVGLGTGRFGRGLKTKTAWWCCEAREFWISWFGWLFDGGLVDGGVGAGRGTVLVDGDL